MPDPGLRVTPTSPSLRAPPIFWGAQCSARGSLGSPPLPRKSLTPSGSLSASQAPGPPRRAINQPEPSVSPALPPAELHPSSPARRRLPPAPRAGTVTLTGDAPGDPSPRHSPGCSLGPPRAAPCHSEGHKQQQQLVAGAREQLGSGAGSRSRQSPSPGTPHLPQPAASRGTPVPSCCPRARASRPCHCVLRLENKPP